MESMVIEAAYLVLLGVLGACVGSFLNVVIYRMPLEISVNHPRRSFCPTCSHTLAWYDNVPILAYCYLRGRCRYCGTAYGVRYPLVEALTALLFVLVAYRFGFSFATPVYLVFVSLLVAVAFIDLDHYIIPTELVWIGLGTAAVALLVDGFVPGAGERLLCRSWLHGLLGAAGGYAVLWVIRFLASVVVGKEAMGLGDLNLLAMFGAFFGWQSLLLIVLLSSLVGAVIGLYIKYTRRLGRFAEIPFGPYLVIAALVYLLYGQELVEMLWGHLGLVESWGIPIVPVRPWPWGPAVGTM